MQTKKCSVCLREREIKYFDRHCKNGKKTDYRKTCMSCRNKMYNKTIKRIGDSSQVNQFRWAYSSNEEIKAHMLKIFEKNSWLQENGCLLWGNKKDRYGTVKYRGKAICVHRVAWMIYNSCPIPKGMFVCHTCDSPGCIFREHLFLGTPKENFHDMVKKGRRYFKRDERCNFSKLKESQVIEIKKRIKAGEKDTKLGAKFDISSEAIAGIRRGRRWKHVKIDE